MSTQTAAAWTPSTPASSLPRAERCEIAGPQRVYFYDLDTRAEIESPLAGLQAYTLNYKGDKGALLAMFA